MFATASLPILKIARAGQFPRLFRVIVLMFACILVLDGGSAFASVTQSHDDYCSCGPKCRRERCCCKPAEPESVPQSASTARSVKKTVVINNLHCMLTSPCTEHPANSELRSTTVPIPTAMLGMIQLRDSSESGLLIEALHLRDYQSLYVSLIYRPPEMKS